jgi:CBS domain-containing protein
MPQTIRDVMTPKPCTMEASSTVQAAAREMAAREIGDVIVTDGGEVCGIVTDRDIAVRAVAEGRDPQSTKLGDVCTRDPATVAVDDGVDRAVRLMSDHAIRRLPVVDQGKPVGIVSLGDLAIDLDRQSALADISRAPANN